MRGSILVGLGCHVDTVAQSNVDAVVVDVVDGQLICLLSTGQLASASASQVYLDRRSAGRLRERVAAAASVLDDPPRLPEVERGDRVRVEIKKGTIQTATVRRVLTSREGKRYAIDLVVDHDVTPTRLNWFEYINMERGRVTS